MAKVSILTVLVVSSLFSTISMILFLNAFPFIPILSSGITNGFFMVYTCYVYLEKKYGDRNNGRK